jgi:branched-chain amino acid transport system substrate-binding protein
VTDEDEEGRVKNARRRLIGVMLSMAVAVLVVSSGTPVVAQQPTVRLGQLAALTGPAAYVGVGANNARIMAVDEINARGGVVVGGVKHKLELVTLDVGNPSEAVKVFERLHTVEKISLIIDGAYSSAQYALGPVVKTKKAVILWSTANDPGTTVGVPNAFRNALDGGAPLMKVTEAFLKKMNVKRVVTIGQTGHADFKRFVEDYLPKVDGIQLVGAEWYAFADKDFFPVLTKVKTLKPDMIIAHGFYGDGVNLLKQARELGMIPGTPFLGQFMITPGVVDEPTRRVFEGTYENLIASSGVTTDPSPNALKFFQNYVKRFGEQGYGSTAEPCYDGVYILAKAMEKAGTVEDTSKIAAVMRELRTDEIPELTMVYKPGKIFDADNQSYPKIIVGQWKGGKLVTVYSDFGL